MYDMNRRDFLKLASGAVGYMVVPGAARAAFSEASHIENLARPPVLFNSSFNFSSQNPEFLEYLPLRVYEPHADDAALFLSAGLTGRHVSIHVGAIPVSPGSMAAEEAAYGPNGPFDWIRRRLYPDGVFRPFQLSTVFNRVPETRAKAYATNIVPIRVNSAAERDRVLAERDIMFTEIALEGKIRQDILAQIRAKTNVLMFDRRDTVPPGVKGVMNLMTLNPWGTYGHPNHIAMSEAVSRAATRVMRETFKDNGIVIQVWHDATMRPNPDTPSPDGSAYTQVTGLPSARYTNNHRIYQGPVRWAKQVYASRTIWGNVDAMTWHGNGEPNDRDFTGGRYANQHFYLAAGMRPSGNGGLIPFNLLEFDTFRGAVNEIRRHVGTLYNVDPLKASILRQHPKTDRNYWNPLRFYQLPAGEGADEESAPMKNPQHPLGGISL